MKKAILVLGLVALAGCSDSQNPTKPNPIKEIGCTLGQTVGFGLSSAIAEKLACKNVGAINDSIYDALVKINVCEERKVEAKGVVSSMCKMVGTQLFSGITEGALASWECEGGVVKEKALEKLGELCDKLP